MPLKLRPATLSDAPVLTDILHRSKASWGYPEEAMATFREHWRISEATIHSLQMTVAERGGRPIGFSGLTAEGEDTLLIDFLFVAPEAQRQGVGNLLLSRAEDYARSKDRTRLCLESDSHAGPFYEQRGFRTLTTRRSEMLPGGEIPLMEKVLTPGVHEVTSLDICLSPEAWGFETAHEAAIGAHFEEARKRNPYLWNGRTLKLMGYRFEDGDFKGTCSESTFAAHLAWRDWGAPDASAYNLFGSAILRTSDGALLYGIMSEHTANAGLIYPPGGNLDPRDLTPEGKVDMIGAIYRELEEETGLTKDELRPDRLLVAFDGPRIAIARVFDTGRNAAELRENIIRFSASSEEQELADVRIIRSREDLKDPAIVSFARAIADEILP